MSGQKKKTLRALGLEVLPQGAVINGMIQNPDVVRDALQGLLKKLKIMPTGRRAALSLGGGSVLIKRLTIPVSKEQSLAEQVYYEAEQHFQGDMAEIYFDFSEIAGMQGPNGEAQVVLVGAKREMVEQYISVVKACGLKTGVVECNVFSVANMFEYNYGILDGLAAVVNIGSSSTQVSLLSRGAYLFTRDIAIGGEEYSRRIMEELGIDHTNAEALKLAASQGDGTSASPPQGLIKVLGEVNDQLVSEIQMTVDYFFQSGEQARQEGSLRAIYLTGGGSRILGLDAALAATLQIEVQIVNPFQQVEVNPRKFQMDYLLMQGHLYGVAVGMGIRSLNDQS
jgi:type IV pilus assembly protein PilM